MLQSSKLSTLLKPVWSNGSVFRRNFLFKRRPALRDDIALPKPSSSSSEDKWPRKFFTGIQPDGCLHLGNYLGVIRPCLRHQADRQNLTICIADMHAIISQSNPFAMRENILTMAAELIACGIDPDRTTIFVQSDVKAHAEMNWLLSSIIPMSSLGQMPRYKEASRTSQEIELAIFAYPVLQAADILLHKATEVPIGEDQLPHIKFAQSIAKIFNKEFNISLPICEAAMEPKEMARVRSLREPSKKMSKSDLQNGASLFVANDIPETIAKKIRNAVTDFSSDVSYDPERRVGISNLINIYAFITGKSINEVVNEVHGTDTERFKSRLSEALIEHLKPIRKKFEIQASRRNELVYLLEVGAGRAREVAEETVEELKHKMGLGATFMPLPLQEADDNLNDQRMNPKQKMKKPNPPVKLALYSKVEEVKGSAMSMDYGQGEKKAGSIDGVEGKEEKPLESEAVAEKSASP